MIVSLIGSLISNIIVILVIAFGIYYVYNKKTGNVKDFKETVKSFVEELKEIPAKFSELIKKVDELKKKLDKIK